MRLKKRPNDRVAVALVLCFCVVSIASIFSMRSNLDQLGIGDEDKINIAQEKDDTNQGRDVVKPVPTVDSKSQTESKDPNEGAEKGAANSAYAAPVKGKIINKFSSEVPIYSKTLDQYVVHNGIDIEAPADAQVMAVAEGTVTRVYTDDKLGITIEVSHGNGLITKYSNLSTTKMVGEGDVVKKGQVISGVGNSALFESLEPSHLHFEVLKDGLPIDPSSYVK